MSGQITSLGSHEAQKQLVHLIRSVDTIDDAVSAMRSMGYGVGQKQFEGNVEKAIKRLIENVPGLKSKAKIVLPPPKPKGAQKRDAAYWANLASDAGLFDDEETSAN